MPQTASKRRRWPAKMIQMTAIILAVITPSLATCPSQCDICESNQAFCEFKNYKSFPADFSPNTNFISIGHNNMTTISDAALSHHGTNLLTLYLSHNRLNSEGLGERGFHQLENLQRLVLDHNRFESVRRSMFAGMRRLEQLWINYNYISIIDRDAFANMSSLIEVKLTGNRLMQVPSLLRIPSLQRIYLDNNRITKIQYSFINLDLHDITLANNKLQSIKRDSFGKIGQMSKFNISGNRLAAAPALIKNMTKLVSLDISRNPITQLPSDLLTNASRIKYLDVSRMDLRTLDEGFIPRNRYLNTIRIANNPWVCNCNLRFLVEWSRMVSTVDSNLAKCANPKEMRDTLIKNLNLQELGCNEMQIQYPPKHDNGIKHNSNGPSQTHRVQETAEQPKTVTCTSTVCGKGGTCKDSGGVVSCECSSGWTGKLCERRLNEVTNAASTTSTMTQLDLNFGLVVNKAQTEMISFYVPKTNYNYLLTVELVQVDGARKNQLKREIMPKTRIYEIDHLAPGTKYRICLRTLPIKDFPNDYLCNIVTTEKTDVAEPMDVGEQDLMPSAPEQPSNNANTLDGGGGKADTSAPEPPRNPPPTHHQNEAAPSSKTRVVDSESEQTRRNPSQSVRPIGGDTSRITGGELVVNPVGGKSQPEENVSMMYPLVGAGLAAFVILVLGLMLYTCQRNKRKLDASAGGGDRYMPGRKQATTGEPLMETTEMIAMQQQQQRNTPSPHYQQPPQPTTFLYQGNNGELYQVPPQQPADNIRTCGTFTPNCNGSLARSSVSGGSNGLQRYSPPTHHLQNGVYVTAAAAAPNTTEPPEVLSYVANANNNKMLPAAQSLPVTYYNSPAPAPRQMSAAEFDKRRRHASETRNCSPMTVAPNGDAAMGRTTAPRTSNNNAGGLPGVLMSAKNGNSTSIQYHSVPIVASRVNQTTTSYTSSYMQMNNIHTMAPFASAEVTPIARQNSAPYGSAAAAYPVMAADCHAAQQPGLGAPAGGRMLDTVVM